MKPIYHYSTVSEALDELNELGFTYDYNIHQSDIIHKTYGTSSKTCLQV
jgi:hypothetical protein